MIELALVFVSGCHRLRQKVHALETGMAEGGAESVQCKFVVGFILRAAEVHRPADD